jgi:hypothetical protein
LAHAFQSEYSHKRLKLVQLLGQLGVFLTHVRPGAGDFASGSCDKAKAAWPGEPTRHCDAKARTPASGGVLIDNAADSCGVFAALSSHTPLTTPHDKSIANLERSPTAHAMLVGGAVL